MGSLSEKGLCPETLESRRMSGGRDILAQGRGAAAIPGFKSYMGASFVAGKGEKDLFNGAVASLKAYDYARTDEQIEAAAGR